MIDENFQNFQVYIYLKGKITKKKLIIVMPFYFQNKLPLYNTWKPKKLKIKKKLKETSYIIQTRTKF